MALTHVLFDFFGTLVSYNESRLGPGLRRSHELLVEAGSTVGYDRFAAQLVSVGDALEERHAPFSTEYSMDDVCRQLLGSLLPEPPSSELLERFRDTYLDEWSAGVTHIPGVNALLADLAQRFTLVLVTNTHHADLVRGHLRAMDATRYFTEVVTSIEHGRRKPAASIFESALQRSGGVAASAAHVGDSHAADFLGATGAGIRCLLIDPDGKHDVPASDRLTHVLEARRLLEDVRLGDDA